MESTRQDFRITVDLGRGTIEPRRVEILQLVQGGELYYREYGGALRPVAGENLHSGDRYVVSGLHQHLADARHETAAELERRGRHLLDLAARCQQIEEGNNG